MKYIYNVYLYACPGSNLNVKKPVTNAVFTS